MTIAETLKKRNASQLPRLETGHRMDQKTFHARYEAMPPGAHAELIGGIVYMASPVSARHGREHKRVLIWLNHYEEKTPGVEALDKGLRTPEHAALVARLAESSRGHGDR